MLASQNGKRTGPSAYVVGCEPHPRGIWHVGKMRLALSVYISPEQGRCPCSTYLGTLRLSRVFEHFNSHIIFQQGIHD